MAEDTDKVDQNQNHEKLRETVRTAIKSLGDEVPPAIRGSAEEAIVKMLEEGSFPKDVLGFTPEIMETIYGFGYKKFQAGKYKDALSCFRFLQMLDPPSYRYAFGIAASYHYLKDYENAAPFYLLCTYLDPNNPSAYFHMYDCFLQQNDPYSALRALKECIFAAGAQSLYAELKERAILEYKNLKKQLKSSDAEVLPHREGEK